jgi:hypothetical protein
VSASSAVAAFSRAGADSRTIAALHAPVSQHWQQSTTQVFQDQSSDPSLKCVSPLPVLHALLNASGMSDQSPSSTTLPRMHPLTTFRSSSTRATTTLLSHTGVQKVVGQFPLLYQKLTVYPSGHSEHDVWRNPGLFSQAVYRMDDGRRQVRRHRAPGAKLDLRARLRRRTSHTRGEPRCCPFWFFFYSSQWLMRPYRRLCSLASSSSGRTRPGWSRTRRRLPSAARTRT